MQFARFIPKQTLNNLEKNGIITSQYTSEIRKYFPEILKLMVDIYYEPENNNQKDSRELINVQIVQIFNKTAQGKFDDNYINVFQKLRNYPDAQKQIANKIIDKTFLKESFTRWSTILEDNELGQNLIRILSTFERKT